MVELGLNLYFVFEISCLGFDFKLYVYHLNSLISMIVVTLEVFVNLVCRNCYNRVGYMLFQCLLFLFLLVFMFFKFMGSLIQELELQVTFVRY